MDWVCKCCGKTFESRRKMQQHKKENHGNELRVAWNKGLTKETNEIIKAASKKVSATLK